MSNLLCLCVKELELIAECTHCDYTKYWRSQIWLEGAQNGKILWR